jgi:hypothetical protein
MLDLRENQIQDLSCLAPLSSMKSLEMLKLTGNPICNSLLYPLEIFKLQPSLQSIDHHLRNDNFLFTSSSTAVSASSTDNESNSVNEMMNLSTSEKIQSLESQLDCFSKYYQEQDWLLSQQGKEAVSVNEKALLTLLITQGNTAFLTSKEKNKDSTTILTTLKEKDLLSNIEKSSKTIGSSFPFYSLLSFWRKEVFKSTYQLSLLQKDYYQLSCEKKQFLQDSKQLQHQLESKILQFEYSMKGLSEKNISLKNDIKKIEKSFLQEKELTMIYKNKNETNKQLFNSLKQYFEQLANDFYAKKLFLYENQFIESFEKIRNYQIKLIKIQ